VSEPGTGQHRTDSTSDRASSAAERPTRDTDGATTGGSDASARRRPRVSARHVRDAVAFVRTKVADTVWLVAVLCAAVLAIGALLVLLGANADNAVVTWFTDGATRLAGPLNTVFEFRTDDGSPAEVKNTVVNWGVAALAFLGVGRLVQRLLRPDG
jgi:hypothetical protein